MSSITTNRAFARAPAPIMCVPSCLLVSGPARSTTECPSSSPPAAWDTWLHPHKVSKDETGDLLDLESRSVASTIQARPVSRAINNVRTLDRHDHTPTEQVTRPD